MGMPTGKHGIRLPALLVVLFLFCQSSLAQQLPFAHLSIGDGLEDTVAFSMEQDAQGFLWIGTRTGLNRFDGANFWTFTQADGLPHNLARDILLDRDGTLWVATERGVAFFDGRSFHALTAEQGWPDQVSGRSLSQAPDGTIWAATYGAGALQIQGGPHARVIARFGVTEGLPTERVRSILAVPDGSVWVGISGHGIMQIRDGILDLPANQPGSLEIRALAFHRNTVWAGTRAGAYLLGDDGFELLVTHSDLSRQTVNSMTADRTGRLWFGTREGGAYALDDGGQEVQIYDTEVGLPDNSVNEVFEDSEGNLWFGTYGGGVARLSTSNVLNWKAQTGFPSPNVYAIADDQRGCMWFGTNGSGVTSLCDGVLKHYTTAEGLPHDKVLSAVIDGSGDPWFGTLEGVSHFRDGSFINYGRSEGLRGMVAYDIKPVASGGFWIGTIDGLTRYDGIDFAHFNESDGLPDNRINRVTERADGSVWLATANGLGRMTEDGIETWNTDDGLPSNFINDLYEDERGLWIATNQGLSLFADGVFRNWSRVDGLPHNNCTVILPGQADQIWVGTSRGVAIFDHNAFTVVTSREGLVFDLVNRGSGYRDPEGNLWFGTGSGVSRFAADFRPGASTPPPVHLLSVRDSREELPLHSPARMAARDEVLTFSYSAISYQRAPDVLYRYRLRRGGEAPWRETKLRELQISSLAPGDYQFEVTARIGGGEWNENSATFEFTVIPPFWQTAWFFALTIAAIVAFFLYRIRMSRMRAIELERTVQERTQQLRELNEGLEWLALHDNLTRLANRHQVSQRISEHFARGATETMGVVIADLDRFKLVNDRYGHAIGDRVLEAFAAMLQSHMRNDQIAARWGGEEFLLLLPGIDAERLEIMTNDLLRDARALEVTSDSGKPINVRCSLGFSILPARATEDLWQKTMQLADLALLDAKRGGRDRAAGYFWTDIPDAPAPASIVADPDSAERAGALVARMVQ